MFGAAILLAFASAGWPYFESRIPAISDALQATTETRIAWFFAGIIPALVIGMRLADLRRRRNTKVRLPTTWVSVMNAIHEYARQDLIDRYEYVVGQSADQALRGEVIDAELAKLGAASITNTAEEQEKMSARISLLISERDGINSSFMARQQKMSVCFDVLRENIQNQLIAGNLPAKGFIIPHIPGSPEKIIPTEEWRFLLLDEADNKALGPNFEYIGVQIGRR